MRLAYLLRSAGYALPVGVEDMEISGIVTDSRAAFEGALFVAEPGLRTDGYGYIANAVKNGAVFVVAERPVCGVAHLLVDNARAATARLYDAWYGHPAEGMALIGITGTNGKTSTAAMLSAILSHAGKRCGVIGTLSASVGGEGLSYQAADPLANMTTPDPAQLYALLAAMRERGVTHAVMEVTSHAMFFCRVAPLQFALSIFTNLTPDHLDLHGDMESYFAEKCKLFASSRAAVVSLSTPYGVRLADSLEIPLYTVSPETVCERHLDGADGVSFVLHQGEQKLQISIPVTGDFAVENGALAASAALALGIAPLTVTEALGAFQGVAGRMERVAQNPLNIRVFLDYAHTPDALEKLLLCLRRVRREGERILLLFGCGGDRDRSKRRVMGRIACSLADFTVITSDNPRGEARRAIIEDILKGFDKEKPHAVIEDRRAAIKALVEAARPNDILVLAGKGHETYELVGDERRPFSEKALVCDYIAEKCKGECL